MLCVGSDTRRERPQCRRRWLALMGSLAAAYGSLCADTVWAQRPFPGVSEIELSPSPSSTPSDWAATGSQALPPPARQLPKTIPETVPPAAATVVVPQSPGVRTLPGGLSDDLPVRSIDPGKKMQQIQQVEFSVEKLLQTPLADVIIEGNDTIPANAIQRHLGCRPGRLANPRMVQTDVSQLLGTRWFYDVKATYRDSEEGPILVFQVVERPILQSVTFRGNKKIKTGELEAHTGLRPTHAYDVSANRESLHRIRQLYQDKGYRFAEVKLTKGGSPDDREVIFDIVEGPKPKIWGISINGSQEISQSILKTKISSKTVKLWVIQGDYDPDIIRNDELALKQYYMGLGYFDVQVSSEVTFSDDKSKVYVHFAVDEGARYRVEGIEVVGNDVVARDKLLSNLKLKNGDFFNERFLKQDVSSMSELYDEQGRIFAKVVPTPRFRDGEEPVVDLVYNIDEDVPRYIGTINIRIRGDYPHSQEEVVRQQAGRFLKPGHLAKRSDIQMAQARVSGSGLWDREEPPAFDIKPISGEDYWPQLTARGQSHNREELVPTSAVFESDDDFTEEGLEAFFFGGDSREMELFPDASKVLYHELTTDPIPEGGSAPESGTVSVLPAPARQVSAAKLPIRPSAGFLPIAQPAPVRPEPAAPAAAVPAAAVPVAAVPVAATESPSVVVDPEIIFRGQSESMPGPTPMMAQAPGMYRPQSIDAYGQQVPQDYLQGVSPQGDPYGDALSAPPPGFVDVNIDVTEGRTGRLMFGVGVNSDAGVVGSLVLQEDNFDILRPPTSWSDILNGTAWRGAGQSLRIEAVPGSEVSRYMATWTDPYFLRSDFSFGVSGFYYNRFFESWTEDRLGGRLNLGYVINKYWSVNTALRLENVQMRDIPVTAPSDLTSVKGDNFLSTGAVTFTYDARDNAFMPTRGNQVSFTYEQAFGEFSYPKFDVSASQYFTVYERPDGFGKQVFSLTGQLGFTGDGTPVFERYFAGGYSSFRGFYFRGVSPVQNGYRVGGDFMALGSAEYMIPVTASDNLRVVLFSDFGTVEPDVSLDAFRLSVGFGFRVTIPAMGPAPLAFDFGFPIMKEAYDRERMFSFYVGFTR